jgi:hypothetical protein
MTPEQFVEHINKVLGGLWYLNWAVPAEIRRVMEEAGGPVAQAVATLQTAELKAAQIAVTRAAFLTTTLLGQDWENLPKTGNRAELARRLQKLHPILAQSWYKTVAVTLPIGFNAMKRSLDVRLELAEADLHWWETILAILNVPGRLVGALTSGAGSLVWDILKPLILPAALIAGGYVLYRVMQRSPGTSRVKE